MRKAASKGMEDKPGIILQAHMDMVCEKTPESSHDFSKDGIPWEIEGDWLTTGGETTLGADDGIGMALAMAALEEEWKHPVLEVLLTTAEEEDLSGAAGFDTGLLEGKYLKMCIRDRDIWEEDLRKFGFYLGKFIYILDAYDDLEEDLKTGSYNPLKTLKKQCEDLETYEQRVKEILLMMMAEATAVFEKLPCLLDAEILRNILYSGVWSKYNKIQKERQEKRENHGK